MENANLAIEVALIIGLLEVIKQAFLKDEHRKFIPVIGLVIGITISILLFPSETIQQSVIDGIIASLSSVGLFSTVKNTIDIKGSN